MIWNPVPKANHVGIDTLVWVFMMLMILLILIMVQLHL